MACTVFEVLVGEPEPNAARSVEHPVYQFLTTWRVEAEGHGGDGDFLHRVVARDSVVQACLGGHPDDARFYEPPEVIDGLDLRVVVGLAEIDQGLVTVQLIKDQVPRPGPRFVTGRVPVGLYVQEGAVDTPERSGIGRTDGGLVHAITDSDLTVVEVDRHVQHALGHPEQPNRGLVGVHGIPGCSEGFGTLGDASGDGPHVGQLLVVVGDEGPTPGLPVLCVDGLDGFAAETVIGKRPRVHVTIGEVVRGEPGLAGRASDLPGMSFRIELPRVETASSLVDLCAADGTSLSPGVFVSSEHHQACPRDAGAGDNAENLFVRHLLPRQCQLARFPALHALDLGICVQRPLRFQRPVVRLL